MDFDDMSEKELKHCTETLGGVTKAIVPEGGLFVTLLFTQSELVRYLSNADRDDIITALQACLNLLSPEEDLDTLSDQIGNDREEDHRY